MGLGPIMSIYQARFNRYLQARKFIGDEDPKVWCFIGDGESDEPETLGSLTLAARENLDNLIWVINCNLQRLDGPVRGNGKIIQELEALFRGAGWNVIKVIWGSDWDDLLARDQSGLLLKRMEEAVDGDYQKYVVEPGSYTRKHFFGKYPELLEAGASPHRRADSQAAARRPRHAQSVCRLQGRDGTQRPAHGDPGQDREGLRPRRSRRGPQHFASAEKDEREGAARVPRALRHSDQRRRDRGNAVLSSAGGQPGDQVSARTPPGAGRVSAGAHRRARRSSKCRRWIISPSSSRAPTTRSFDDDGLCAAVQPAAAAQRRRQESSCPSFPTKRARSAWTRCSGRSAFIRPKASFTSRWTARSLLYYHEAKDGQILEEGITEAGSMASFIAAGTSVRDPRRADDSVLHLLFDVRSAARRRSDVAGGRHQGQGLSARRHLGPHHAQWRRLATSGRSQPAAREHDSDGAGLRSGVRLRNRRHHHRRFAPHVCGRRGYFLLSRALQRESCHAADAGRRRGRHFERPVQIQSRRGKAKSSKPTSSAAARSSTRR